MRAFEFLIEYNTKGKVKGTRDHKYRDGGKPDWYEKAVQLKTDNPRMTAVEIGRQLNPHISYSTILNWLTGYTDSSGRIYNDNPPFTEKDFPDVGNRKYFDGEKPWWYEEARVLRKQGMTWQAISNKISTPEEKVSPHLSYDWLTKGRIKNGKLVNPDAPFTPRPRAKPINTDLIKELIVDKYTDEQIIELIADEKGDKIAGQVRAMLPKLRQALQPGTSVIDKKTGERQDWVVQ